MKRFTENQLLKVYAEEFKLTELEAEDSGRDDDLIGELRAMSEAATVQDAEDEIRWWDCWDGDPVGALRSAGRMRKALGIIDPPTKCRCCGGSGIVE